MATRFQIIVQLCILYIVENHGQGIGIWPTDTSTKSTSSDFRTTLRTISTTRSYQDINDRITERTTTVSRDRDVIDFINTSGTRRTRPTTTRRPLPELGSLDPPWGDPTPRTTRRPSNTGWITPTTRRSSFYPPSRNERPAQAPMANFTAVGSSNNVLVPRWNSSRNIAYLPIRNVRELTLTFTCNATYPIEWLSQTSFGTSKWKLDDLRHFPDELEQNGQPAEWYLSPPPPQPPVVYTVTLELTYEKEENVPNYLELNCASVRSPTRFPPRKQTLIEISKGVNATLRVYVFENILQWPKSHDGMQSQSQGELQYREPLGANVACLVDLQWFVERKGFGCTSERQYNLTIDYKYDNCYDWASCERKFTRNECWGGGVWSNPYSILAPTSDIWTLDNPPSSGIVYCGRKEDVDTTFDNRTAAIGFFHSLPHFCPEDNRPFQPRLYTISVELSEYDLRDNFVSFCATPRTWHDNFKNDTRPLAVYVGENVTVTCIVSMYHFAMGTRLALKYYNRQSEFPFAMKPNIIISKNRDWFNYTAKIQIKSDDVDGLICENYKKQSAGAVQKIIPIEVKLPQKIAFIREPEVTEQATWKYTGQSGFVLKCEASGDPPPTITWKRQGRPIPEIIRQETKGSSTSVLRFPSLKENTRFSVSDLHGLYTCEARNKIDFTETTFLVQPANNSNAVVLVPTNDVAESSASTSGSLWVLWIVLPIFAVLVLAVIGVLIWKIKIQSKELRLLTKAEVDEFLFGKPEMIQHHASSEEVNNYAPFLPYNRGYEIGKDQLEIDENAVLGSGAYAIVLRGTLIKKGGDRVKVAIKTSRTMDDISYFKALLSELKIMGFIGTHSNIVNLVGAHTKNIQNREIFIAIEFCENGNLLNYLRDHRNKFTNLVGQDGDYDFISGGLDSITRQSFISPGKDPNGLNTVTLIKWVYEVATGMEFLSNKKVIHGDLAARNILLNEHLIAKIGDFGLSRQLFEYVNYIKKQQSPLPWKWLAIECLQDMRFSVKSDVWAYAILMYEIFSLGHVPYPGHSYNDEFLDSLIGGKRPNRPSHATNVIYDFMGTCWKDKPEDRPNFTQVREFFNKMLSTLVPQEYLDLHEKVVTTAVNINSLSRNGSSSTLPSTTTNAVVYQNSALSPGSHDTANSNMEDCKQTRFSFNTKTITAMFHRN